MNVLQLEFVNTHVAILGVPMFVPVTLDIKSQLMADPVKVSALVLHFMRSCFHFQELCNSLFV